MSQRFKVFRCPECEGITQEIENRKKALEHKIAVRLGVLLLIIFVGAVVLDLLGVPVLELF